MAVNPGSREALAQGCICPVMDNNHGKWPPFPATEDYEEGWYLRMDCPVHGVAPEPIVDVETGGRL